MGFFSKLFGGKKELTVEGEITETLNGIIEKGNFDLEFTVEKTTEGYHVNFSGTDSELLTSREGLVLDSFQIYLKRLFQNKNPDAHVEIVCDCNGFLEKSADELKKLAAKLRDVVVAKGAPAFVRPLPPRERKIVHRFLAEDTRVRSQSIGEGFCKKIRITSTEARAQQPRRSQPEAAPVMVDSEV